MITHAVDDDFPTVLEFGDLLSAREQQIRAQDRQLRERNAALQEKDRRIAELEARSHGASPDEQP